MFIKSFILERHYIQPNNIDSITNKQILIQTDKYKMVCFVFEPYILLTNIFHIVK